MADGNAHNAVIAFLSGVPTYFAAAIEQTPAAVVMGIVLPVFFFFLGKGIDVGIRLYIEKKRVNDRLRRRAENERLRDGT
jgi:xanthine/uracil permease